jgi:hypothetical protein
LRFEPVIARVETVTVIEVEVHVVAPEQVPLNFIALEPWGKRRTFSAIDRGAASGGVEKLVIEGSAIRSAVRLTMINRPGIVGNTNPPTNARIRHTSTHLCKWSFFQTDPCSESSGFTLLLIG